MRRPLTELQISLIERHRQQASGRGIATARASQRPPVTTGLEADWAAARTASQGQAPRAFGELDAGGIWAKWNQPPVASLREQVEQELHREAAVERLDAAEILRNWNTSKPAPQP